MLTNPLVLKAVEENDPSLLRPLFSHGTTRRPKGLLNPKSALMLSGHNLKHLSKLSTLSCDVVILNLEDGVSPTQKPLARTLVALALQEAQNQTTPSLVVRVNPLDEGGRDDIEVIAPLMPDAIRLPKVKTVEDVTTALTLIPSPIALHLSIETKEALSLLAHIKVDPRVEACYLGILDLLHSLNLPQSLLKRGNPTIDHLLAKFLVDAKTAGITPFSFVYQNHTNLEEFTAWCSYEKEMGFTAKGCISPSQVAIANKIFENDTHHKEKAISIIRRFEEMASQGITGFVDEEYGFIDEPIYKDALLTLSL